jgi:sugar lactone lactonase YvrE
MGFSIDRVGSALCGVGESPLWSPVRGEWHWVDIAGARLWRWVGGGSEPVAVALPGQPGCIALAGQGQLVCAIEDRVALLHDSGAAATELLRVVHPEADMRFNDGRCDRQGRFWVSSMVRDMGRARPAGELHRFSRDGGVDGGVEGGVEGGWGHHVVLGGLIVPNGLAFSPTGELMYLSDSHPSVRRIWACSLDAHGMSGERRLFVDMAQHRGRPDGAAVDAEGCYWSCANDGGCLLRFTPQGRLDRTIELPVAKPSMCAFGGAGLDELLITSIRPPHAAPQAIDGATLICRPGVRGLAETPLGLA